MKEAGELRVGPAGWSYADWRGVVYPLRRPHGFRELAYLTNYFDVVEINTSFYQPLRPQLAEQWLAQITSKPHFQFTAKLWQKFTHEGQPTTEDVRSARSGFDVLLGARRLGAILMQFPFSFHRTAENAAYIERLGDSFRDYPLVLEVRHSSWNNPKLHEILRSRNIGLVNLDQPLIGRAIRPSEHATSAIGYFRLHGRRYDTWFTDNPNVPLHERYNYLYSEEELKPWANRIKRVALHTKSTFVIMNNHYSGKGVVNAFDLLHLLGHGKVDVPETLRRRYPHLETIAAEPPAQSILFRSRD